MPRRHWRRFLPPYQKKTAKTIPSSGQLFTQVRAVLEAIHAQQLGDLEVVINDRKTELAQDPVSLIVLLILQSPRAAIAQESMDKHPHGYRNREKRLYELIDFNDMFVSSVLALPEVELETFTDNLKREMDIFCRQLNTRSFSNNQYEAIVHGLSREIAVYRAALKSGFEVVMTSRIVDALGADMQIRSPESGSYINIDCKTSSAFHFRIKDLVRQERISFDDQVEAEEKGYWEITNRSQDREMRIVLLRINQEELGEVHAFSFADTSALTLRLLFILNERGLKDNQFNKDAEKVTA